jgi:hypothetical protein
MVEQHVERRALDVGELTEGERERVMALAAGFVLEDGELRAVLHLARDRPEEVLERGIGRLGTAEVAEPDGGISYVVGHEDDSPSPALQKKGELGALRAGNASPPPGDGP